MNDPREDREKRAEELEKAAAMLLMHAAYSGAAYPTVLRNVEDGYVQPSNPKALEDYLKLSQEYDKEKLQLSRQTLEAVKSGQDWGTAFQDFLKKQADLSLRYAQRELELDFKLSREAKADLERALEQLKEEEALEAHPEMAQLVRLIEAFLQRASE